MKSNTKGRTLNKKSFEHRKIDRELVICFVLGYFVVVLASFVV